METNTKAEQPGFIIYWEDLALYAECLSAEQLGHVLNAVLLSRTEGAEPELDTAERLAYREMLRKIDIQAEKYRNTVERNRANARKHSEKAARKRATAEEESEDAPTEEEEESEETETDQTEPVEAKRFQTAQTQAQAKTQTEAQAQAVCMRGAERKGEGAPAALPHPAACFFSPDESTETEEPVLFEEAAYARPTLAQVREFVAGGGLNVDPDFFYAYYDAADWRDSAGRRVRSWRKKAQNWDKYSENYAPGQQ